MSRVCVQIESVKKEGPLALVKGREIRGLDEEGVHFGDSTQFFVERNRLPPGTRGRFFPGKNVFVDYEQTSNGRKLTGIYRSPTPGDGTEPLYLFDSNAETRR